MSRLIAASAALSMLLSISTPVAADAMTATPDSSGAPGAAAHVADARAAALAAYRRARADAHRLGVRAPRARVRRAPTIAALRRQRAHWMRRDRAYRRRLRERRVVLRTAARQIGAPYRWGGASPAGFDCSGLVMYAYGRAGIRLPHSSYALLAVGRRVARSAIRPGDLVFSYGGGHVGIYAGRGSVISAPHTGSRVSRSGLATWPLTAVRRIV